MTSALERQGVQVTYADNGKDGLALLDGGTPEPDGIALAVQLKNNSALVRAIVLMMTVGERQHPVRPPPGQPVQHVQARLQQRDSRGRLGVLQRTASAAIAEYGLVFIARHHLWRRRQEHLRAARHAGKCADASGPGPRPVAA